MLPEFLLRAWLAGLGVAIVAGPLGCFVVWRRVAYFGDTLAHGALLGVTLGFFFGVDLLASGLSDVLAVSWRDLLVLAIGGATVMLVILAAWRWLLFATVHEELARARGCARGPPAPLLMLLVAVVIAAAMKIVGILLITSMLIIPTAARQLARPPEPLRGWPAVPQAWARRFRRP